MHIFFVAKVPDSTELDFCEEREEDSINVEWLDSEALVDEKVIGFPDQREYFEVNVMPIIRALQIKWDKNSGKPIKNLKFVHF